MTYEPQQPLVSVIVPVYNAMRYLEECVDSLVRQTYARCEIILVDDGSSDSSGTLCDTLAAHHPSVRVVHKSNGGVSEARNAGIDAAKGDYLLFVDADDVAVPDMVAVLLDTCRRLEVPVVQGGIEYTADVSRHTGKTGVPRTSRHNAGEAIAASLYQEGVESSVCGTIYNATLWHDLRFRRGRSRYEDLDIYYRLFDRAGAVGFTDRTVYLYRQHADSYMHTFNERRADVLDVCDRMTEWMAQHRPTLAGAARIRRLSAAVNILGLLTASGRKVPELRRRCEDIISADATACLSDPRAKRPLRMAMRIYRLTGPRVLARLLAIGYRMKERSVK